MILMRPMNAARYSALVGGTTAIAAVTLQAGSASLYRGSLASEYGREILFGFLDVDVCYPSCARALRVRLGNFPSSTINSHGPLSKPTTAFSPGGGNCPSCPHRTIANDITN
jgi:hypothetical protein